MGLQCAIKSPSDFHLKKIQYHPTTLSLDNSGATERKFDKELKNKKK
jgi:hypothetical protein